MTQLLERALEQARQLPDSEQDFIARMILDEIEDERGWDERFRDSQDELALMAQRVRAEIDAGLTEELDFNKL
jgi:hypothetical protein